MTNSTPMTSHIGIYMHCGLVKQDTFNITMAGCTMVSTVSSKVCIAVSAKIKTSSPLLSDYFALNLTINCSSKVKPCLVKNNSVFPKHIKKA